ncbi:MAG: hypothetical protein PHY34_03185 [Patescibacteria group bacterium]|nr:hypothetical protein [Patescibacteria group bacterium]
MPCSSPDDPTDLVCKTERNEHICDYRLSSSDARTCVHGGAHYCPRCWGETIVVEPLVVLT